MRARHAVAVLAVVLAAGCGVTGDGTEPDQRRELGQEIVVTGAVQRRIDAVGFVIETEGDAHGLLVVAPSDAVRASEVVEVRGVVRRFERRSVEGELGRPLRERRYAEFEGRDFLRADRVTVRD